MGAEKRAWYTLIAHAHVSLRTEFFVMILIIVEAVIMMLENPPSLRAKET